MPSKASKRIYSCDPNVEILGVSISSLLTNIASSQTRPYMKKYGLDKIDNDKWYRAQDYMDVVNEINQNTNAMQNLVAVGMQIAKQTEFPPGKAPTFEEFLMAWDDIYYTHFRGGDVGHIKIEKLGSKKFRVINTTIHPDDMVYGVAYGFGKRLLPSNSSVVVKYEDLDKRMDLGAKETVMLISWA